MITNSDLQRRYSMKTIAFLTKYNNPDIMQFLFKIIRINVNNSYLLYGVILEELCKWNYYDTLLLYFQNGPLNGPFIPSESYNTAFGYACKFGYLNIAKWLFENKRIQAINISNKDNSVFFQACENGHIDIVQWLLTINPSNQKYFHQAFINASMGNHLELAKWILQEWNCKPHHKLFESCKKILEKACAGGYFELAKWLVQIDCTYTNIVNSNMFRIACEHGHMEIAKWIRKIKSNIDISLPSSDTYHNAFELASQNGHMHIIQWLFKMKPIIKTLIKETAFCMACENGHLNIAQWLLKIGPTINVSVNQEYPFCLACENGHIHIAQWLFEIKPTIDVSATNEYAFCLACENGHIHIAQWLFEIKPTINISTDDEYAFRYACKNGHLEVAQWLLQIKPTIDISATNEYAFRYTCKNGHLEVAQWLLQIKPNLNVSAIQTNSEHHDNKSVNYDNTSDYENESDYEINSVNYDNGSFNIYEYKFYYKYGFKINYDIRYDNAFSLSCKNGHINIATWLMELESTIIQSVIYEDICNYACEQGNIDIIQLIIKMNKNMKLSEISQYFWLACLHGHIDIAIFLHQVNPSITFYYDDITTLEELSNRGHTLITNWLHDIMPYIKYVQYQMYGDDYESDSSELEYKQYMEQILYYLDQTNKNPILSPNVIKHIFLNYYAKN